MTSLTLTLFLLNLDIAQDEGRRVGTEVIKGKSPWVHKIVPILNRPCLFNCLLNTLPVPAFKFGLSLNCAKQRAKGLVMIK